MVSAALMVPMLLDFATTPASVRSSVPCGLWSWKVSSARCSTGGTTMRDVGLRPPSSRTAAAVMTLLVDPGS